MRSRTDNLRIIKTTSIIILFSIITIYAISRSLNYVRGPEIKIFEPINGYATTSQTVTISGQVLRINKIFLNGNPIFIDENGYWKETIVIFTGLNRITINAGDQFGRNVSKELDLVGQ